MKFIWDWCEQCEVAFIRCPKCGNNCCNGGYGEVNGEKCDVCPLSYQYQKLAYKTNKFPRTEKEVKSKRY